MNDRLAKAEALFHDALELPPERRESFLQTACGDDAELLREVAALLRASGIADEWLKDTDCAAGEPGESAHSRVSELPGTVIGRYKLLEKIGEGGFGVVYMAEQREPVRRKVAFKIIKLGMDTKSVVARFEAERQALALMDHPNIAKVLDAGATETGRPYFVMELVRGVPVTKFCEENQLGLGQRLDLFIQICSAIQHAHQKGTIHRDIKPTNVLVTSNDGVPHPMVIDFGVAKVLNQRLTEKTLFTNFAQMIGTPAYMSPEQAEMTKLDVDTRSDVYSLGVLLYELLTGTTPFLEERLQSAGFAEMTRIICEEEPERPSTRVTCALVATGASRQSSQSKIQNPKSQIERDLDWIVMKCLEKDRSRRYDSASALANDLRLFLNHEPVVARPPSNFYRLQKLIRRNQLVFTAIAAVAAALLLGVIGSMWQAVRATHAEHQQSVLREQAEKARTLAEANERKARTEATKSRHVAEFMKTILEGVGPSVARGRDTTMLREILDQTAARLGEDLEQEPEVAAELRLTLGQVYGALGELNRCEQMFRESLVIRRTLYGTNHVDVADSLENLAWVFRHSTNHVQAAPLLREALAINRKLLGDAHPKVARTLCHLALVRNDPDVDEVEALFREALATRRKLFGTEHPDIALLLHSLGTVVQSQGKLSEAEFLYRQSLAMGRKLLGENVDVAHSLASLCNVMTAQDRLVDAENLFRELLAMWKRLNGNIHPAVANTLEYLSGVLQRQHKWSEAESLRREALMIRSNYLGNAHRDVAQSLEALGFWLRRANPMEAERLHREAVAIRRKVLATDRPGKRPDISPLGTVLDEDDAETGFPQNPPNLAGNDIGLAHSLRHLAQDLRAQGKWVEAKQLFLEAAECGEVTYLDSAAWFLATCADPSVRDAKKALGFAEKTVNATQRKAASLLDTLAAAYAAAGRFSEAVGAQREAIALMENPKGRKEYGARLRLFQSNLPYFEYRRMASCLRQQGRLAEAERTYRDELTMRRTMFGDEHPEVASCLGDLAAVLQEQGKLTEAEPVARECLAIREKQLPDDWLTFDTRRLLGANLLAQKRHAEAEPLLRSAAEDLEQRKAAMPPTEKPRLAESVRHLVQLYETTGQREKAAEWRRKLVGFHEEK